LRAICRDGKSQAAASLDLLREMVKTFAEALMAAEARSLCNAGYRQRTTERTNSRNGYRPRDWDTRGGTIEVAVPKLRSGSYFPDWLLEHPFAAALADSSGSLSQKSQDFTERQPGRRCGG
jgi:transposase-like protein